MSALVPNDSERYVLRMVAEGKTPEGSMARKLIRKGWLSRNVFDKGVQLTVEGREFVEGSA